MPKKTTHKSEPHTHMTEKIRFIPTETKITIIVLQDQLFRPLVGIERILALRLTFIPTYFRVGAQTTQQHWQKHGVTHIHENKSVKLWMYCDFKPKNKKRIMFA